MSVTIKYNVFCQTALCIEFCFVRWYRVEGKYWHHGKRRLRSLGDRRERKNNHARLGSLAPLRYMLSVLIIQLLKKNRARRTSTFFSFTTCFECSLVFKVASRVFPQGRRRTSFNGLYGGGYARKKVPGRDFTSWSIGKDRANDKLKKGEKTFWFCDLFIYSS